MICNSHTQAYHRKNELWFICNRPAEAPDAIAPAPGIVAFSPKRAQIPSPFYPGNIDYTFYPGKIDVEPEGFKNMSGSTSKSFMAFAGHRLILSGSLVEVTLAVKQAADASQPILVFDDATGRVIDVDVRGTEAEIVERSSQPAYVGRYRQPPEAAVSEPAAGSGTRGKGRPKMGVVAREVTLLPRQWEWLASQSGGASATLRKLVDNARRSGGSRQQQRAAQDAAYHFMQAIAGDFPGYEEATRALFANDRPGVERCIAAWPHDIRTQAIRLAFEPNVSAQEDGR